MTPDSAIGREQETGGSSRVKVDSPWVEGYDYVSELCWRREVRSVIGPLARARHTGRPSARGTHRSHCTH